jgi:hypothetical protein
MWIAGQSPVVTKNTPCTIGRTGGLVALLSPGGRIVSEWKANPMPAQLEKSRAMLEALGSFFSPPKEHIDDPT